MTSTKKQYQQFKILIYTLITIYPFWLLYGLWKEAYIAPVILGTLFIWGAWYVNYTKKKAEEKIKLKINRFNIETLDIKDHINFPLLVISLIFAGGFSSLIVFLINFFLGAL